MDFSWTLMKAEDTCVLPPANKRLRRQNSSRCPTRQHHTQVLSQDNLGSAIGAGGAQQCLSPPGLRGGAKCPEAFSWLTQHSCGSNLQTIT